MHDDEIDLVDLARVLIRRRWVIVVTFLLVTIAAAVYAFAQQPEYRFTSSIKLPELPQTEQEWPEMVALASRLEPESVAQWVSDGILTEARKEVAEEQEGSTLPFGASVSTSGKGAVLSIETRAEPEQQELVTEFHERIVTELQQHYRSEISPARQESRSRVADLRERLETVRERLASLQNYSGGRSGTGELSRDSEDLSRTETAMIMLSQLHLTDRISDHEQELDEIRAELRQEKARQARLETLVPDGGSIASLSTEATNRTLVLVLGALLGAMLGVFMAFFAEFAARVREAESSS